MTASSRGTQETPGKNVKQKAGLNRSLLDVSLGEFFRLLAYKAQWYGREVIVIDRFSPSSKTCSQCDHRLSELSLSTRSWTCPACGAAHERDLNASRNIARWGIHRYELTTPAGTT